MEITRNFSKFKTFFIIFKKVISYQYISASSPSEEFWMLQRLTWWIRWVVTKIKAMAAEATAATANAFFWQSSLCLVITLHKNFEFEFGRKCFCIVKFKINTSLDIKPYKNCFYLRYLSSICVVAVLFFFYNLWDSTIANLYALKNNSFVQLRVFMKNHIHWIKTPKKFNFNFNPKINKLIKWIAIIE